MFCQECGAEIRQTARFCNKCGGEVKQRFGQGPPPPEPPSPKPEMPKPSEPPPPPPRVESAPLREKSWPRVDHTLVMPTVSKTDVPDAPPVSQEPRRRVPGEVKVEPPVVMDPRPTLLEPTAPKSGAPKSAVSESAPHGRDEILRPAEPHSVTKALRREFARKPFFTEVVPAVSNRQHSRLMLIVPWVLLLLILVFVLAYHAAK